MADKKASMKKLEVLHGALAEYYKDMLEDGDELSSGFLNACNTFLKNNEVSADIAESEPMMDLTKKLRDLMDDDDKGDK